MQRIKTNLIVIGLSVLGISGVVMFGILLVNPNVTKAASFCEASVTCPDKRELVCKGSSCSADQSDPSNPTCTADGKTKKCSDPVEDTKGKKKKDKNKDDNSNVNMTNISNTNGNTD